MTTVWYINCETVRTVCIKNGFYNAGTNKDYENMFSKIREREDAEDNTFTLEEAKEIAEDIAAHTEALDSTTEYVLERILNSAYLVVK